MKRKNIILLLLNLILLIFLIFLSKLTFTELNNYINSYKFYKSSEKIAEETQESVFSINKITYFSSAIANVTTNSNSAFAISNLYQYTDIAIFIEHNNEVLSAKNTLKTVTLNNFDYTFKPSVGTPNLYFKNITEFATPNFLDKNLIKDSLTFNATSSDVLDYSTPTLFNNCANPITLCYVNSNIKNNNYVLPNSISNIAYNGSLLKNCGITLNSISCKITFDVIIINNLDEKFTCPISFNIPLSTEKTTIYDGSLTFKDTCNFKFIKKF